MLNVKNIFKGLVVGLTAIFLLSTQANAEKPLAGKNVVFMVSASDADKAGMGIGIGMVASKDAGANVTIVVGAGAVKYVLKSNKDTFKPMGKSFKDIVATAVKSGANIYICGMFAKAQHVTQSDVVDGVKIVDGAAIFGKVFAPEARVISF